MWDTIYALFNNEETRPYAIAIALGILFIIVIAVILGREVRIGNLRIGPKENNAPTNRGNQALSHELDHFYPSIAKGKYWIVRLPKVEPIKGYGNSSSPKGYHVFYDIPFFFQEMPFSPGGFDDHVIIDIQPDSNGNPTIVNMPLKIRKAKKLHVMLSAGHGRREYMNIGFEGKRIGWINIIFDDNRIRKVELILGKNIREWACGNRLDLVREISDKRTKPAWTNEDQTYIIDMMSINLGLLPRDISQIQVVAEFEEKAPGIQKPAVRISAITCEC